MRTIAALVVALLTGTPMYLSADRVPLKVSDVMIWKRIQTPIVSNDEKWLAYKFVPDGGTAGGSGEFDAMTLF